MGAEPQTLSLSERLGWLAELNEGTPLGQILTECKADAEQAETELSSLREAAREVLHVAKTWQRELIEADGALRNGGLNDAGKLGRLRFHIPTEPKNPTRLFDNLATLLDPSPADPKGQS